MGRGFSQTREDVLNKWYTDFATLLNTNKNPIPSPSRHTNKAKFLPHPNETFPPDMPEEALPDTIDQDLVKWALLRQKNGKAVGPDGLPVEVIKKSSMLNLFFKVSSLPV